MMLFDVAPTLTMCRCRKEAMPEGLRVLEESAAMRVRLTWARAITQAL
jgi:hypothetical protein